MKSSLDTSGQHDVYVKLMQSAEEAMNAEAYSGYAGALLHETNSMHITVTAHEAIAAHLT